MLADLESDLVERKESLRGDNPRKIRQAVCAFANDLPDHQRPGVVFVGADDAGAPVGLKITDMRVLGLAQRYGAGIPTARRALLNNGQPEPDFRVEPNWVHCTVRARM